MRQVSPESPDIFDFIMELYRACSGDWNTLVTECNILLEELEAFFEYAGMFLCNLGNLYGEGDQKFVPDLTAKDGLEKFIDPLLAVPRFSLGYPSKSAHCCGLLPRPVFPTELHELAGDIFVVKGNHAEELAKVCWALEKPNEYAGNNKQTQLLSHYIECFRTRSLEAFQEAQKAWVTHVATRVEHLMGFIEPYRDPAGIRSEWEAMVGITDPDEAARLKRLVESSTAVIRQPPWAVEDANDGKGPIEESLFEALDFTSVHALAVCGSIVFEAANLPNYEYIRETCGFKNVVLTNRLNANNNPQLPCYWVAPSQLKFFKDTTRIVRFITTATHELLGHETGKLATETAPGIYNFNEQNLPTSPISKKAITSHYLPGQTWASVFGKLVGTVEECRAILVSEYLLDDKNLLGISGYTDDSEITASDFLYATYLNIGVDILQALEDYNFQNQAWGQVHHQANFSILKHLQDGDGVIRFAHDPAKSSLTVHIDRSKIISPGKPALGRYLSRLHIWRCTADVSSCKDFYEPRCAVEGKYEQWRRIVCSKPSPRWKLVQPNTFVKGDTVEMKVYEENNRVIIQSWVERDV
ncbi:peptidase family M49-domain-containing protein [Ilyonectria robusta]|uniref:peptidase family M49-domain-containing protein n=1 Tax=Ilyonectria robusta TaxID=1079257 RepID=UPI001E8E697D|nr:peptidase family M49-domain-containing protein [Ilyonectria robusta]KAH8729999.1 peptidase family M49-domain-containing protein [Ilyonectria robusta]